MSYKTLAYVNLLHSGTGFVLNGLFRGNWVRMDAEGAASGEWPVAFSHFWLTHFDWLDEQLPHYAGIITSTRNGIEASWLKRRPWAIEDLAPERESFAKLMDKHNGIVIDLDDKTQRQNALDEINRRFDLSLTTDWQPLPSMY
jgi:hypothetical protein